MTKAEAIKTAKRFFKNHSTVNRFNITADGKAFFDPGAASLHAKDLQDKTVIGVNRSECDSKAPVASDEVKDEPKVVMVEGDDDAGGIAAADEVVNETAPAAKPKKQTGRKKE